MEKESKKLLEDKFNGLMKEVSRVFETSEKLQIEMKEAVQKGNFKELDTLIDLYVSNREEAIIMMEVGRKYGLYENIPRTHEDFWRKEIAYYKEFKKNNLSQEDNQLMN